MYYLYIARGNYTRHDELRKGISACPSLNSQVLGGFLVGVGQHHLDLLPNRKSHQKDSQCRWPNAHTYTKEATWRGQDRAR